MGAPIRIIVTAVSGGSVGEQICKALALGVHNYELVVTNTSLPPMRCTKAHAYELLPPSRAADYLESVKAIAAKYNCDFIIPGSESELLRLSDGREQFADIKSKLLINSAEVISLCLNKLKTCELLSEKGFAVPETVMLDRESSVREVKVKRPCIVKPAVGGAGSAFAFIAQDDSELVFFLDYLRKNGYLPLIQEYVGSVEQEYTVGVLHAPNGTLLGTSVMRRDILSGLSKRIVVQNLTSRAELGSCLAVSSGISQGQFERNPAIRDQCEKIATALGSKGPMNIQGRWDGERFITFEINPRFSGTSSARAMAAFNEPELLIDWYLYRNVPEKPIEPQLGKVTRSLVEHFEKEE